eukprot:s35_g9.t1
MGDALESENCTICYDPILSQPTVALACGHVYHLKCIDSWLGQCTSGSELCPQCKHKTRKGQLRVLQYDVVPCLTAPHEVQRDLAATAEADSDDRLPSILGSGFRAAPLEERQVELAGLLEDLKATQDEASQKLQEVRSHYDSRMELVFRKLPIDPVGEHDQDYLEDKVGYRLWSKRLELTGDSGFGGRVTACSRCTQISRLPWLCAQKPTNAELPGTLRQKELALFLQGAEKHLMGVHLEVEQLMKAKAAIKATKAKALPKAAEVLDQSLAPSLLELKREVMATAPVKAPKPPKRARSLEQAPKESDDDMADFLGPSSLCPSSSRVLYEILIVKLFLVSMGSFPTVCTCGRTFNWRDKGMDHSVGEAAPGIDIYQAWQLSRQSTGAGAEEFSGSATANGQIQESQSVVRLMLRQLGCTSLSQAWQFVLTTAMLTAYRYKMCREEEFCQCVARIDGLDAMPTVVLGDFNFPEEAFRPLLRHIHLLRDVHFVPFQFPTTIMQGSLLPKRIEHIISLSPEDWLRMEPLEPRELFADLPPQVELLEKVAITEPEIPEDASPSSIARQPASSDPLLPPKEVMSVMQWVLIQSRDMKPGTLEWWTDPLSDNHARMESELRELQRYAGGLSGAVPDDHIEMLEVLSLSGETWELEANAFEAMVAQHGNSARGLKRHLQGLVGIPRFRQRLLQEARVVEDTEQLALPMSLQLVILPFVQLQDSECNDVAQALAQQDQDELELLLQRPVDPNTHAKDGTSPLHRAMDGRYWETVRLLVEAGVDVDETCRSTGLTPLGKAFYERHLDMARFLLDSRAQVDKARTKDGSTPLLLASECGYRDSVQLLVASRAALDATRARDGSTSLLRATERGHVKVVELLIGARANLDIARTDDGKTPLIRALDCENSEIIRLLIEARSDLEKESAKNGTTPLLRACERGRANLVRRLLDARAEADRCHGKTGWTPLQTCITHRQVDIARMLLEARADLNKESTTDGRTPLLRAVEHGIPDMVQFLVEAKADPQKAHDGRAPLFRASARGDLTMVRQLVLGRADLDAVAVGTTPLLEAVESGHPRTVQFLIESRADLEKPGHDDTAPLLRACELRKYALVSLLLEQRADVNKKRGADGETATSRALACGYSEIVRALAEVEHGWCFPRDNFQLPCRSAAPFLLRWLGVLPEPIMPPQAIQSVQGLNAELTDERRSKRGRLLRELKELPRVVLLTVLCFFGQISARHGSFFGDFPARLACALTQQAPAPEMALWLIHVLTEEVKAERRFPPLQTIGAYSS